jgi:hypothetical protein
VTASQEVLGHFLELIQTPAVILLESKVGEAEGGDAQEPV